MIFAVCGNWLRTWEMGNAYHEPWADASHLIDATGYISSKMVHCGNGIIW